MFILREKYRGRRKISWILEAVDDSEVTINYEENNEKIPTKLINKAKLVPNL